MNNTFIRLAGSARTVDASSNSNPAAMCVIIRISFSLCIQTPWIPYRRNIRSSLAR